MDLFFLRHDKYIECTLCPHYCHIKQDKAGICSVRKNTGDTIELTTYGVISGYSLDPVEKKPLYHFFPGSKILSAGSYGCNMRCDFCQNWQISQKVASSFPRNTDPQKIVDDALAVKDNIGIAFTYNEPVIWFEFMRDVAILAKESGLYTAMVSNGYVNSHPLGEITGFIDAFNIDLKAFNDDFYRRLAGARLDPVKGSLRQIARSGKHIEITTLIIPGKNDSENEMEEETRWIAGEIGPDTPFHLSRYFPSFRRDDPATPHSALTSMYEIARKNLNYVYLGNTSLKEGQNTYCTHCGTIMTTRTGYSIRLLNLDEDGKCSRCGKRVYTYFTLPSR
jgi:pyruvate formate lyase activating enzyme